MAHNFDYPGVYIEEISTGIKPIEGVSTSEPAFLGRWGEGPKYKAIPCLSYDEFEKQFGGAHKTSELSPAVKLFFANGGTKCYVVGIPDDKMDINAAVAALDEVDIFGLMVLPPDSGISESERKAAFVAASEYCEKRRAFMLIDAPRSWPKNVGDEVVSDFREGMVAESAAVFYPRIVLDAGKTSTVIGPTGAIAGLIARSDVQHGVWKAAAGIDLEIQGVVDLEQHLTDDENGKLNALAINCLRKFPTDGIVNWGARTLAGADGLGSDWKYIPVRRLALFIEESVRRGTQWAVFEPNEEKLWQLITSVVFNFMLGLWKQGALFGAKPAEAFFINCNRTTMTQDDIDQGRINIEIGMAAVKPAEFVLIRIQQIGLAAK